MKWIVRLLYSLIVMILLVAVCGLVLFFMLAPRIPRLPDDLRLLASSPPTEVYSRDGEILARIGGREYVPFNRISPHFLNAVVAIEDKRFYRHHGVDHIALIRAIQANVFSLGRAQGGSTITQQLAKNLFFTFERSWKRKLLEGLAAFAIEDRFSKEDILEAYANLVYYGRYAYGVERAAKTYFGKHAVNLELHESALLAGLPNSPSFLNPVVHLERARVRQRRVLERMAASGMIAESAVDSIIGLPLEVEKNLPVTAQGSFPVDYAIESAGGIIGSDLVSYGGVRIITSLDPTLQGYAEQALARGLAELESRLVSLPDNNPTRLEGALVAIDVSSGQIVALVGGRDYRESAYNRAVRAKRQPGSAFKPVIYLTALEKSAVTPATILEDKPLKIAIDRRRTWSPDNFDKRFRGPVTLKWALMQSINTISAQLITLTTPQEAVKTAGLLGITTELKPYPSLALGAQEVTPLEMASVFATLAHEGVARESSLISRIEGRGRDVMFENLSAGEMNFSAETVYLLIDMMKGVIDNGTGKVVRRRGFKGVAIGKTGTSSDYHDSWFCGATPSLAVVVWVGYDDSRPMKLRSGSGVTGASGAAPIWADFMIRSTAGRPIQNFPRPFGINEYYMQPLTGIIGDEPRPEWITVALREEVALQLMEIQLQNIAQDTTATDSSAVDTEIDSIDNNHDANRE